MPSGKLEISYQATVELSQFYEKPDAILKYYQAIYPWIPALSLSSRYCQSDKLMRLAYEFRFKPGYSRVTAICNWIYDNVAYLSFSSNQNTSAYDTATERVVFVVICPSRCLLPSLEYSGALCLCICHGLNPPDFHACFEAYLGQRWYLFDPSRLCLKTQLSALAQDEMRQMFLCNLFGQCRWSRCVFRRSCTRSRYHLTGHPAIQAKRSPWHKPFLLSSRNSPVGQPTIKVIMALPTYLLPGVGFKKFAALE